MDTLPTAIVIKIFDYLDHEDLMNIYNLDYKKNGMLNDYYKNIIKNNVWNNITIKLRKKKRIEKFIETGWVKCFTNYDLSGSDITNDLLKHFSHSLVLNFQRCGYNLTNNCTQYMTNCHTVDLSYNFNINDEDIKYLQKCRVVKLEKCQNLTDQCIKYLKNCNEVNLNDCPNITHEGLKNLSNYIVKYQQSI